MIKNKKRKMFAKILPLASFAIATPIITTSCSSVKHINFLVNYDNALDLSLSLGIAPDYYLSNTYKYGNDYMYATYLQPSFNSEMTQIKDIRIYDGEETDLKSLARLEPYTMLMNEWERVDADEYKGIVSNLAYTSMGDTINERWNSSDSTDTNGFEQDLSMTRFYTGITGEGKASEFATTDYGVSPQKAALEGAEDLDEIYGTGGLFTERASVINDLVKKRISAINKNTEFQNFISLSTNSDSPSTGTEKGNGLENSINNETSSYANNVSLCIISGGTKNDSSSFKILTPNAVPLFYSQLDGRGLGFNFADPVNSSFKNTTNYSSTWISATDSNTLLTEFAGKFDYIIYFQGLSSLANNVQPNLTGFEKLLKTGVQSQNNRIYTSTYFDIYMPIWGMMGYSHLLNLMVDTILPYFTNSGSSRVSSSIDWTTLQTLDTNNRVNYPKKENLVTIRSSTNFETFPTWSYAPSNSQTSRKN